MSAPGATVAVVSAGYPGKRRAYLRMAELGASLVIVDEPGHWSESLVAEGVAAAWLSAPVDGDPDRDAQAVLAALAGTGVRPDGVLTFWEDSVGVAARVAAELGLAGNPNRMEVAPEAGRNDGVRIARRARGCTRNSREQRDDAFAGRSGGCIRVDDLESLPGIYTLVRRIVDPELDVIFRAGNDLLLEEYLDGVEFDVDLVMQDGECLFSSVSQNWPTAEPSFQETGLHCPPDHDRKEVRRLVRHVVETVRAFGLGQGALHVEGKCTSRGPRIVEVNARMGGGRVHEFVEAVWGVDLVEAQLQSCLGLPQNVRPSRRPQAAAVNVIVYAPATGRLEALPIGKPAGYLSLEVDDEVPIGTEIQGPEAVFATALAEVTLVAKDLRTATALIAEVLRDPPRVAG